MSVTIPFPPEIEQRLRERAAAAGQDVDTFVREAVEEKLSTAVGSITSTKQKWFEEFAAWQQEVKARSDRYPAGYVADDRRDSIYEGR